MKRTVLLLALIIASVVSAAEITFMRDSGENFCFRLVNSSRQVYDFASGSFGLADVNDANGFQNLTEDANTTGLYYADFPSVSAGRYYVMVYNDTNTAVDPNISADYDGGMDIDFDGTYVYDPVSGNSNVYANAVQIESADATTYLEGGSVAVDVNSIGGTTVSEPNDVGTPYDEMDAVMEALLPVWIF